MRAHKNVSEEKPPDDPDSPLSFTMEGFRGQVPSSSISYFWAPGWSSIQSVNKFQIEVGGRLHGGDPGKRLIEPTNAVDPEFYQNVPNPFHQKDQAFQVIPLYHIFGSEAQSMNSPAIQERSVEPYLALNPKDAEQLDVQDGASLTLESGQTLLTLPVHIKADLPAGLVGYPRGLPGLPELNLPALAKLHKVEQASSVVSAEDSADH